MVRRLLSIVFLHGCLMGWLFLHYQHHSYLRGISFVGVAFSHTDNSSDLCLSTSLTRRYTFPIAFSMYWELYSQFRYDLIVWLDVDNELDSIRWLPRDKER